MQPYLFGKTQALRLKVFIIVGKKKITFLFHNYADIEQTLSVSRYNQTFLTVSKDVMVSSISKLHNESDVTVIYKTCK